MHNDIRAARLPSRWSGLKILAVAAVIAGGLTLAPPAFADCGPVPDAQAPLPTDATLVWAIDASGNCILATTDYQCANAAGESC